METRLQCATPCVTGRREERKDLGNGCMGYHGFVGGFGVEQRFHSQCSRVARQLQCLHQPVEQFSWTCCGCVKVARSHTLVNGHVK